MIWASQFNPNIQHKMSKSLSIRGLLVRRMDIAGEINHPANRGEPIMQYMFLIYNPEPTAAAFQEAMQADLAEYNAFTKEITDRKLMVAGEALQ